MDHFHEYKVNSRIKDIINRQRGVETTVLSNVEAENIIIKCLKGIFKTEKKFKKEDKNILLRNIYHINPNDYTDEHLKNLTDFIKQFYEKDEIIDIVQNIIRVNYKPAAVAYQIRLSNDKIVNFLEAFSDSIKSSKGILINSYFIGDVKKLIPDIEFDENTGKITSENTEDKIKSILDNLKIEFPDIKYGEYFPDSYDGTVYVISSENEATITVLNERYTGLKCELVPEYYFNWL